MTREQKVYMLPISFSEAVKLQSNFDVEVYQIYEDDAEGAIEDIETLLEHAGATVEDEKLAVEHESIREGGSVKLDIILDVFNDFGRKENK